MLSGAGGTEEEFQEFLVAVTGTFLLTRDPVIDEEADAPMWAADSSVPEEWFFNEEP